MSDARFAHPLEPYPKLIINAALTGVIPTKADNPNVPVSVEEIVSDAVRCTDAGASIIHVHARDAEGKPTGDTSVFAEIITGIRRQRPAVIICATTSGRRDGEFDKRSAVLMLEGDARPDMASLTTGSLNFAEGPSINAPEMIEHLARTMQERGIKPELEALELGMVNTAMVLIKKGLITPPYYFNILLGGTTTAAATLSNLCTFVNGLPAQSVWAACGLGRFQLKINTAAILMGGHVRVGLEDNVFHNIERTELATNVGLIERIVRIAREFGREPASPLEARTMLGLAAPDG